jgi:hypothetical protein
MHKEIVVIQGSLEDLAKFVLLSLALRQAIRRIEQEEKCQLIKTTVLADEIFFPPIVHNN